MDMDDDDRIVYGWDFSVTQQEQEQQDKRILGVRIFGTGILPKKKFTLFHPVHIWRHDIRDSAGQRQGISPHEDD